MASAVQERLAAYARAHELTRPGLIEGGDAAARETTLHVLIETILAPYANPDGRHVSVEGDDVALSGSSVTSLALVLHELATNAAKYGALSVPDGHIRIACTMRDGTLALEWKETGGPPIAAPPQRQGFGSQFTGRTVRGQFGGTLVHEWEADGVRTRIVIPAEHLNHAGG
jgi:two-component system CheB/CheR fusion protein